MQFAKVKQCGTINKNCLWSISMSEPFISKGRWVYKVVRADGAHKTFTSVKTGLAGKKAVLKKGRDFIEGGLNRSNKTVKDFWPAFLAYYKNIHGLTEGYYSIKHAGESYVLPQIAKKTVSELKYKLLQNVIMEAKLRDGTRPSRKTLERIRTCISQFSRYLALVEEVCEPILVPFQLPYDAARSVEREILQPEDLNRLFNELDSNSGIFIFAYQLGVCCGLRPGELLGLKKDDIDYKTGEITISRSLSQRRTLTSGKNKNAHRTFVLTPRAMNIVKQQLLKIQDLDTEWLFPNNNGELAWQSEFYREYKRLGFPGSPYCLRHTHVSLLKNVPDYVLKQELGHSPSMPTRDIYSHSVNNEAIKFSEIISNELEGTLAAFIADEKHKIT